jgi:hypothetical protein
MADEWQDTYKTTTSVPGIGDARETQEGRNYRVHAKDNHHFERDGARSEGVADDDVNILATGLILDHSRFLSLLLLKIYKALRFNLYHFLQFSNIFLNSSHSNLAPLGN